LVVQDQSVLRSGTLRRHSSTGPSGRCPVCFQVGKAVTSLGVPGLTVMALNDHRLTTWSGSSGRTTDAAPALVEIRDGVVVQVWQGWSMRVRLARRSDRGDGPVSGEGARCHVCAALRQLRGPAVVPPKSASWGPAVEETCIRGTHSTGRRCQKRPADWPVISGEPVPVSACLAYLSADEVEAVAAHPRLRRPTNPPCPCNDQEADRRTPRSTRPVRRAEPDAVGPDVLALRGQGVSGRQGR